MIGTTFWIAKGTSGSGAIGWLGGAFIVKMFKKQNHFLDFGNLAKFGQIMPLFMVKMAVFMHVFESSNFGKIDFFLLKF